MTSAELVNALKYIAHKCDLIINHPVYRADDWTQDKVEDIAELCYRMLDGQYGPLTETKYQNE